jgi:hypothetical protein
MSIRHWDGTTGPRDGPAQPWGESVSEGSVAVTLRFVLDDEVLTVPVGGLKQWGWTISGPGTERVVLCTSQMRIQVEGSDLEPIHRLLDALRVRELRVSRGTTRVPGKPWIERIVFEPFPRESRDGRARPPAT